jgi:hypothetical protein
MTDVAPKAEETKVDRFYVMVDASGKEVSRKKIGRGKRPEGAVKLADGNWQVPVKTTTSTTAAFLITLDENGKEVNREEKRKGKGRVAGGFVKATEGEFAGNWVKRLEKKVEVKAETPATTIVATPEVKTDPTPTAA